MFERLRPWIGRSVLEIGSGIGNLSAFLVDREQLVLTDTREEYLNRLRRRFAGRANVSVARLYLPDDDRAVAGRRFDTIICLNVLEHIDDDTAALRALAEMTEPGGRIVLWVPAYMQLYGDFDRAVGHVRRYTPRTMTAAIRAAGLEPRVVKPVNLLGGIAWWVTVRRGGVGTPDPRLVRLYDRFVVPVTRLLERRVTPPFGQSVLAVAVEPAAGSRPGPR